MTPQRMVDNLLAPILTDRNDRPTDELARAASEAAREHLVWLIGEGMNATGMTARIAALEAASRDVIHEMAGLPLTPAEQRLADLLDA